MNSTEMSIKHIPRKALGIQENRKISVVEYQTKRGEFHLTNRKMYLKEQNCKYKKLCRHVICTDYRTSFTYEGHFLYKLVNNII
jgi:hypothetical protein